MNGRLMVCVGWRVEWWAVGRLRSGLVESPDRLHAFGNMGLFVKAGRGRERIGSLWSVGKLRAYTDGRGTCTRFYNWNAAFDTAMGGQTSLVRVAADVRDPDEILEH